MFCLFATATVIWLYLDHSQPNWDDAWYLTSSLAMYDALASGGLGGFVTKFFSVLGFKAPLITALPAPLYLVFGRHWKIAFLVNIAAMAVLFSAVYSIGKRCWNKRAGLVALYVAGH